MDDFRHRVARRGESGDAHHAKTNIRYRASTELAQSQAQELRSLKKQQFFLVSKLAASQASRMSWKARCRNAAGRGDVRRVTDELTKAYEDGKFEGKTALWNFLSDLIHCAASEPDKNGRRATIRYHGSTHRFFAVLRKLGGPRTQRFITANFGRGDEQTSQRFWSVRKHRYMPGFSHADETATYLEQVYAVKKKELGITHPVLCELSEDETNPIEEARWNAGRNAVVGT